MTLFDELVKALEPALKSVAPFTAARLLMRARVHDRDRMTPEELGRVRPMLVEGLSEVLSPPELSAAMGRIDDLIRRPAPTASSP